MFNIILNCSFCHKFSFFLVFAMAGMAGQIDNLKSKFPDHMKLGGLTGAYNLLLELFDFVQLLAFFS